MTARRADSSYPADAALLDELRAAWPAAPAADRPGAVGRDVAARLPSAALRLGGRFAVALIEDQDGSFLVLPLVRDDVIEPRWRHAIPGDGLSAFVAGVPMASEAGIEADQTNVSVVVGGRAIVKWSRRVGPEPSRAAILLDHLDLVGFREMPTPLGFLVWDRPAGPDLVIAQGDAFLPGARDGWEWCVERLERHVDHGPAPCPDDCDPWIGASLGRLVARLHAALMTPSEALPGAVTAAEPAAVARWRDRARRTLDEALRLTLEQDEAAGAELTGLAAQIREDVDALGDDRAIRIQPVHGDLHVGQVLEWSGGLAVIDFDGNPTLDSDANAILQPPERDIAQMASSLDHVARIVDHRSAGRGREIVDGWITRTRREFLDALDPDPALLAAFEAEQECRELVYAARFLRRWRHAPLATLRARYGGSRA